ncbi:MAG TPA: proline dehydrogenase family protein [Thermoanaerobaculia bacterium]|nr:proline dehydrogenase family protein [Thermoanaerobaculia bacterium]
MFRAFFIALSESRWLRALAERSRVGRRLSRRFVAGMEVEDALAATAELNAAGMSVTIDNLGENVTDAAEAHESAALYHELLDQIHRRGLDANVSVKLTHMGLDVDPTLARSIVEQLVAHAARTDSFVRIDMEGSAYTQKTLDLVREIHREPGNGGRIGAVLQAYLHRTETDAEVLCAEGIRIRLCKGAYKEPASIAYQAMSEVDASFVRAMEILLRSGIHHGIATHDPDMIDETIRFATAEKIPPRAFEFQMLHGIRRDLQQSLVRDGWRMRVYVPFGREWYPYLMRRLAERPANALFILRNLFRR